MLAIVYTLAAFGLAFIISFSKISLPIREWIAPQIPERRGTFGDYSASPAPFAAARTWLLALLECPACLGFWTGVAAVLLDRYTGILAAFTMTSWPVPLAAIFLALYTCATNFILGSITKLIEV